MNQPDIVGCGGTFMGGSNAIGLITKLDTAGNMVWLKSLADSADLDQFEVFDIYPTLTGTQYLICGKATVDYTPGFGEPGAWAGVIDQNGNMVSSKTYCTSFFSGCNLNFNKPVPAVSGAAYAFVGQMGGNGAGNCVSTIGYPVGSNGEQGLPGDDVLLIKTDASLDTVMTMRYSLDYPYLCSGVLPSDSVASEYPTDFIVTSTGFVFSGYRLSYSTSYPCAALSGYREDGFLLSVNFNGSVNWARTYSNPGTCKEEQITDVLQDAGGNFIAIGNSYGGGYQWIMRINATTGATMWCNTYTGTILQYVNRLYADANTGNYIVGSESANQDGDMLMFEIDINGNVIPAYTKEIGRANWDEGASYWSPNSGGGGWPLQSSNGTYFLMGDLEGNLGNSNGFMMAKLNKSDYTSGCNELTGPIVAAPIVLDVRTPTVRQYAGLIQPGTQTLTPTTQTTNLTSNVLCTVTPLAITAAAASNASCFGSANGSATATITTATTPNYTYSWNTGASTITSLTTNTLSGVGSGTYTVTVTDATGATATATASITQPGSAVSATASAVSGSCGSPNGQVSASASGGNGGFAYSWSTGSLTQTVTGLAANTYTVTVTDSKGCTATSSAVVGNPGGPTAFIQSASNINCFSQTTGSATVMTTGGTLNYTYSWSPGGETGMTAGNLGAGTYTVTVTDHLGCTSSTTVALTQPATAVSASTSEIAGTCGSANGQVSVSPSGGSGGFGFSWTSGAVAQTVSGLAANTYTVTVTDSKGCTVTSSAILGNATGPAAAIQSAININCFGTSTGSTSVLATGGTLAYTYSWSPSGGTGMTASGLGANTYVVTVTDHNGCTATTSVALTQPAAAVSAATANVSGTCGNSNGQVSVTPGGGTAGYGYSWSSGAVAQTVSGLAATTYTVTVTDSKGCTATSSAILGNATGPSAFIQSATNINCFGQTTGSASVQGSGGTLAYTYSWSPVGGAGMTASGLGANTYTVTVTDHNGCTATTSVALTQPAAAVSAATANVSGTCGNSNGQVSVTPGGGTAGYGYSWSSGAVAQTVSGLAATTYTVTVTDSKGCTATSSAILGNANGPAAAIQSATNINCFGTSTGSASVLATGGTVAYTYSWSPSGGAGMTASGLAANTYTVTVTDHNGCTAMTTVALTQPPVLNPVTSSVSATCGGANGNVSVSTAGGTPGYTYSWSEGAVSPTVTGLGASSYTVTVSDSKGCTQSAVQTVNNLGGATVSSAIVTNVKCFGSNQGSASASAVGGTPSYTYTWSNGTTGATSVAGLTAGTYTVSVYDAHGCLASSTVSITQPLALATPAAGGAATCGNSNGQVSVSPSGGTPGYSYKWSPGAATGQTVIGLAANSYTVTVTDQNGCTGSSSVAVSNAAGPTAAIQSSANATCNGTATGSAAVTVFGGTSAFTYSWSPSGGAGMTASNLSAANYTVTVTDNNGCTATATVAVTQPLPVTASSGTVAGTCGTPNGQVSVIPGGGTSGYFYQWSNGASGQTVSGLGAGSYGVTVTDSKGCTATSSAVLINMTGPTALIGSSGTIDCFSQMTGSASVQVSGGTASFTYAWSPGGGTGITATGLGANTYAVTVTDHNGCTASTSVTLTQPSALDPVGSSVAATCGSGNGSVSVSTTGGSPSYTYSWSSGAVSQTVSGLGANSYTVTVSDSKGCTSSTIETVNNAGGATVTSTDLGDVKCFGSTQGSASASAVGGTPNYTYTWSNGVTGLSTVNGLTAGTYTVSVFDANGCLASSTVSITQPAVLLSPAAGISGTCGNSNGQVSVNPSGGMPGYAYSWSSGAVSQTVTGLSANTYTVTVTDVNGCTSVSSVVLNNLTGPTATIQSESTIGCNGASSGSASVTTFGGTSGFTYSWTPSGGTGITASNLGANSYTVTVTDANGCTGTASVTLTQPSALVATPASLPTACGSSNGQVSVSASGGNPAYSFSWSGGASSQTVTGLGAGSYTVTVTDMNGCSLSTQASIANLSGPTVAVNSDVNVSCFGMSNGSVSASVSGGSPTYTYSWSNGQTGVSSLNGLAAGTYSVTVIDVNGCLASGTTVVSEPGVLNPGFTSSSNIPCFGALSGSVVSSVTGGTPSYSYSWSNGASGSSVSGIAAGSYTLTVTDANGCSASQSIVLTQAVQIKDTISSSAAACGSKNGSVSVQASGGTGSYLFSWSNGSSGFSTGGSLVSGLPGGSYTVTITDGNSCTKTDAATVVNTGASGLSVTGSQTICIGQTAAISANALGGTAPYTYSWSDSAGYTGPGPRMVDPVKSTSYSVSVIDSGGCASVVQVIKVTVNPPLSLSAPTGTVNSCNGSSVTLNASGSGGNGGPYTYSWSPVSSSSDSVQVSPTSFTTYTVTVMDGCSPAATTVISVTVHTPPSVNISSDVTSGCGVPFCVQFSSTSSASCISTMWNFGDKDSVSASNPKHCYASPGSYTVGMICTDVNGCTASAVVSNMVNVYSSPVAKFSFSPSTGIKMDSVVSFTSLSTGATALLWNFGDSASGSQNHSVVLNPFHTYMDSGSYCVKLMAFNNSCVDSVISCFGIEQACTLPKTIPNVFSPNSDGINDLFLIKSTGLDALTCTIFNRWGMLIYEYDAIRAGWDGYTFGGEKAPAGTYYYILQATCPSNAQLKGDGFLQLVR